MRVYRLTPWGSRVARSTRGDSGSGTWKAVYYLDRMHHVTDDQLRDEGVSSTDIARLRRGKKPLIEEIGE